MEKEHIWRRSAFEEGAHLKKERIRRKAAFEETLLVNIFEEDKLKKKATLQGKVFRLK